jgi:hypothetical protein
LKPEDRFLLICLRQHFSAEFVHAACGLANNTLLDWEQIAQTAEQHGISSLIFRNLTFCQNEGLDIPEKALQKLKLSVYKNTVVKERQTERLIRALSFLHERNLEVMLLKGAALDCCVYENADDILSGDVDIMIHTHQEDLPQEKLKEINIFLDDQGIEYEFFVHHDLDINRLLPIDFTSIWENAVQAEYHGFPVLLMSATDLLLSLCINSSRKRYFRLKSVCDISETIRTYQDISWKQLVVRARAFQCENIIFTALLVTSLTAGCDLPTEWEDYFRIHDFRKKMIKTAVNLLIKKISFSLYPFSGISITGRSMDWSLILPYMGYSGTQLVKKLSYAVRVHGN